MISITKPKKSRLASWCLLVAIAMLFCLGPLSCSTKAPPTESGTGGGEVFDLTCGIQEPAESPTYRALTAWGKWLKKESGGRIRLTVLPSEQAAKAADLYDAARQGIVDIALPYSQFLAGRIDLNEVTGLPFIFGWPSARTANLTHLALFEKYPELQAEFQDVKVLYFDYGGPTQIQTVKRPVHKMADLKGLVQLEIGPYAARAIRLLGAQPEMLSPTENYDALAKGVADGISVNWDATTLFHYDDHIKYSTEASLCQPGYSIVVMNKNTWERLPADLQELFTGENIKRMASVHGYLKDQADIKARKAVEEKLKAQGLPGVYVLPAEERQKWEQVCRPLWDEWVQKAKAKGANGQAILEDCLRLAKEYAYSGECEECASTLSAWESIAE